MNRPFATPVFDDVVPGTGKVLSSSPASPATIGPGGVRGDLIYLMLHGLVLDGTRFRGEDVAGQLDAMNLGNVARDQAAVVFSGCCWGAMWRGSTGDRCAWRPARRATARASLSALEFLASGALAFVGCTGVHYPRRGSATTSAARCTRRSGDRTTRAILRRYRPAGGEGRVCPRDPACPGRQEDAVAIEMKILRQFTCLGLGWP